MKRGTTNDLLAYFASLTAELERFAVTILPPNDDVEAGPEQESDGSLVIDLECRLPASLRSAAAELDLFERWAPADTGRWDRIEYSYELRHRELQYRRAFHRHDVDRFVRSYDVATHEHCETTLGLVACRHYYGEPVADAIDAFRRLYSLWLESRKPDCDALRCLD